jgi:hypothetical protein
MPWGGNGFLRASEQLSRLFHERFPAGKVWLSTWFFDSPSGSKGDYDGLFGFMRKRQPGWLTGILGETHAIQRRLGERPAPERYPLVCFPEISMYLMNPWGGYGANPLPSYCTRFAADVRGRVAGGWPYSEGIYEDVNKFFWSQFCWSQERQTDDILREYASYYLCPEATDDAVRLFHLMEQTHARSRWRVRSLAGADEAGRLAEAIDARLPAWARDSWRWRIVHIRAAIDKILLHKGYVTDQAHAALEPLCDEIVRIYHAEKTWIRPPPFAKPKNGSLAFGRPVTVSSTHPDFVGAERMLTDGLLSQDDPQNFWVHDAKKEKTAWVLVDLGASREISEVCAQFRSIHARYWFVPTSIAVEISEDGQRFEQTAVSQDMPKEGADYSPKMWTCTVGKKGRYLRLTLGPSQHVGDAYAGTLELTEIEVYGR